MRYEVIATPKGLWPYKVQDTVRQTHVARCNSKQSAEKTAAKLEAKAKARHA